LLFSSPEFLFGFLPLVAVIAFLVSRLAGKTMAIVVLVVSSLIFYGWSNPWLLFLLCGSVVVNFLIGRRLVLGPSRVLLGLGICLNIGALGYFKYAHFIAQTISTIAATDYSLGQIVLPLAISFFTFQQIAFLVDAHRGKVDQIDFLHYGLFVVFFPQLIAGPIVHHSEIIPQFRESRGIGLSLDDFRTGLLILAIGLYKKVVIADTLAGYADPVFAASGNGLSLIEAWGGVLCFTFQIYFDFSGYSDMAIGLARIFGIRLPLNFHSPYKANSIIDFWRRWHMTLSRFLRDYLYFSLGGNQKGRPRRYANLMITMLLGGLWHGAGWTFVFWGALHGFYLVINHAWHAVLRRLGCDPTITTIWGRAAGRLLTFLAVVVGWVFFRAADWQGATDILSAMAGMNGVAPEVASPFTNPEIFTWLTVLLGVVWFAPNTQQWLAPLKPALSSSLRDAGITERDFTENAGETMAGSIWSARLIGFATFTTTLGLIAIIVVLTRSAKQAPFIYMVF
jgi:D-alanyl-lipoteichoic acid acyltransferase DltB (MBOAT superfamily)